MSQDKIAADVFRADKISLIDYTRNKLAADCMATQGYPQLDRAGIPRPASTYANMDPTSNLAYAGDVVTAQRLGFGKDEAAQSAHVVSFDPAFDHALLGCQQVANGKIGPDVVKVQSRVRSRIWSTTSLRISRRHVEVRESRTSSMVGLVRNSIVSTEEGITR